MEIIKRKILLEDLISRQPGINYGSISATSVYVNIMLTQTMDDMGMFTDIEYIPNEDAPIIVDDYYSEFHPLISGYTDSKITGFKSYSRDNQYNTTFILDSGEYLNYNGDTINGVSKIIDLSGPTAYTFNVNSDILTTGENQVGGILYHNNGDKTKFQIKSEGWNETNTSLSGLTKEEIFFGIISPPETKSDVFIERGNTSVLEPHLRLSEIESISHLEIYNNKFYNMIK